MSHALEKIETKEGLEKVELFKKVDLQLWAIESF
jgi:hypothetical protein